MKDKPAKLKNQLIRAILVSSDLMDIRRFIQMWKQAPQNYPDPVELRYQQKALQTAIVVTYGRIFQKTRKQPSLVPNTASDHHIRHLNNEQKAIHDTLMQYRNDVYAHSNADEFNVKLIWSYVSEYDQTWLIPVSRNPFAAYPEQWMDGVLELITVISKSVHIEIESLKAIVGTTSP